MFTEKIQNTVGRQMVAEMMQNAETAAALPKEENPMTEYKTGRQIWREKAIAISNTVNEITEAIKDARAKGDYRTVADLTNTLVALLTVTKKWEGEKNYVTDRKRNY